MFRFHQLITSTILLSRSRPYSAQLTTQANVLKIGDTLKQSRIFTCSDITDYSKLTHDHNPLHFDLQHAEKAGFTGVLVPGILVASLFPNIIASHFPGAVYLKQTLDFKSPAFVEQKITGKVHVSNIRRVGEKYMVKFATTCFKDGEIDVISGEATAILPTLALSKIIQNPSYVELQKAANQGRRCTWEKLSTIKANCGIELALDECAAVLNHMRRLKRSAERAAAASHGPTTTVRFNASKRIPSWNVIARENSTGSLEEDLLADVSSSLHQGVRGGSSGQSGRNFRTQRYAHDGSDSESESVDLNSWTRSGGPLMRTTSADQFIDFVQNLGD